MPKPIKQIIINSPFDEPKRHFHFDDEGITSEIRTSRRVSTYRLPIPGTKKKGKAKQEEFDMGDLEQANELVNELRAHVNQWRKQDYTNPGPTRITRKLLEHWYDTDTRMYRFFFCQLEAIETAIYLTEVAPKHQPSIITRIREANKGHNPDLPFRIALKMATGSGKTVVMAMLIAWQALNKIQYPTDTRFSDTFLVVAPGITIRDRLRVLLPNDPDNYYSHPAWKLVPDDLLEMLSQAKIKIINYHQFQCKTKETVNEAKRTMLGKARDGKDDPFIESPAEMVTRILKDMPGKKNIVVINDEAHHCYLPKPDEEKLTGDERKEAEQNRKRASLWINGLTEIRKKVGIKAVYDLSATPFFLKGSGYGEGRLFPWVVSDFSLVDAVECGVVKVPRLPVADNSMLGDMPMYRKLWPHIGDELPKYGRGTKKRETEIPHLPEKLEAALISLYQDYKRYFDLWEKRAVDSNGELPPPVFIVVCQNTNISKLVYDYIAGWERPPKNKDEQPILVPGKLDLFNNVLNSETWRDRPYTILVDSEQLESDDAMSTEFKKVSAAEIEQFKRELRTRGSSNGVDPEKITDKDLLREVMNTVGKPGRLGGHIRCVVSVSMLTEGWDASTVSHILGVRAFGTQLLCEQVVGRGLRRTSYETTKHQLEINGKTVEFEAFQPEFSEIYGVPFDFMQTPGGRTSPQPPPEKYHVRALPDRINLEIQFPRLIGYRYEWPRERLRATFSEESQIVLSPQDFATVTEVSSILGESKKHTLEDLKNKRPQEVAFHIARYILERYYFTEDGDKRPWFFPDLIGIVKEWLSPKYVIRKDDTYLGLLLIIEKAQEAAEKVYQAIVATQDGEKRLLPIFHPFSPEGSTRYVHFDTAKSVYATRADLCHVNYVVADTDVWEQAAAHAIESLDENGVKVYRYVKNEQLGFNIPYSMHGRERQYRADFIVVLEDGHGPNDPLHLIVEISGAARKDKEIKVSTATNLWIPAVNNDGSFGRWAFVEVKDPWDLSRMLHQICSIGVK
ncbi:DEAD/DEAH box helicase family protein [bacterium]|nr:DEAD/DEAH box helicase family protein [bacterium]